jgi:hypothetical protein
MKIHWILFSMTLVLDVARADNVTVPPSTIHFTRDGRVYRISSSTGQLKDSSAIVSLNAVDEQTKAVKPLSGQIEVKAKNPKDLSAIAKEYDLKLEARFHRISTAYFRAKDSSPENLALILESLRADKRVVRAELSFVPRKRHAK